MRASEILPTKTLGYRPPITASSIDIEGCQADWKKDDAEKAIGQTIYTGGNNNGRIDNTLEEAVAVWEQLARANFLGGGFTPATAAPTTAQAYAENAPKNAFNGSLILTRNQGYTGSSSSKRLSLHIGRNIPVNIARELDVKTDDSRP